MRIPRPGLRPTRALPSTAALATLLALTLTAAGCGGGDGDPGAETEAPVVPPHEKGSYLNLAFPSVIAAGESTSARLRVVTQAGLPDYDFEGSFRVESRYPGVNFPENPRWEPDELGFYRMKGFVFDAPGVHYLRGVVPGDTIQALANPIVVQERPEYGIYWGDLNGHSDLSDGASRPGVCWWYSRAVALLDFAALTDNDALAAAGKSIDPEAWADAVAVADENVADGEFVSLLGFEWTSDEHGNRIVLFEDAPATLPGAAAGVDTPAKLRAALSPRDLVMIPHPGGSSVDPPVAPESLGGEELVEIYSGLGSFEESDPLRPTTRDTPGPTVSELLAAGFRPGFTASSDSRVSMPGNPRPFVAGEHRWPGGLTAVLARELTRSGVLEALRARRCYATTGERYLLEFTADGAPMGSELHVARGREVEIYGSLGSSTNWLRAELLGPDGPLAALSPSAEEAEVIELSATTPPVTEPTWVYLRGIDELGGMAWSSPIYLIPE